MYVYVLETWDAGGNQLTDGVYATLEAAMAAHPAKLRADGSPGWQPQTPDGANDGPWIDGIGRACTAYLWKYEVQETDDA